MSTTKFDADVIIIGGGFAGITAGRELSNKGHKVVILEAKDRLGGRTWFRQSSLGRKLEFGGTWVHWIQPHVWAEIVRYDLTLTHSPVPAKAIWSDSGGLEVLEPDALFGMLDTGLAQMDTEARIAFPNPHDFDANSPEVLKHESMSVEQKITELGLPPKETHMLLSMMALNFNGDPGQGAYTQQLRWSALCGGNWKLLFEACAYYKFLEGTKSLIDAIQSDSQANVRLECIVSKIRQEVGGVILTTSTGECLRARQVIVATPLNTLRNIDFSPALEPALAQVSKQKHAALGVKIWIRVQGRLDTLAALASSDRALNFMQVEYEHEGDTLIVAFGPRVNALDLTDRLAVEYNIRQWLPDAQVVGVDAHDWTNDPYSGGTWPMLRPQQLQVVQQAATASYGRVQFCGSDFAQGWAGFIDGAIESGKRVGCRVSVRLRQE